MRLASMVEELDLTVICGADFLNRDVLRGYASDLMSDVIANGETGDVWLTMQIHLNVVAVAAMKEVSAVILSRGRQPEKEVVEKAVEQDVVILSSDLPTFEIAGRIHRMGIFGV